MRKADWTFFRNGLLAWYRPERRPMPWKEVKDPYHIWLSEIILQQTRVEQGLPYYQRFLEAYPRVSDLAAAHDDDVMKLWEGLGYYSRARNLLRAARTVSEDWGGQFPKTYDGLLTLPGVGPYTAAAVASFAFGERVAVLDGNVFRVLARFSGDSTPSDTGKGRKHFQTLADQAIGDGPPATFNQAIMDFGALVCTPRRPDCKNCPLATECRALAGDLIDQLPVKGKKMKRRERHFHYLVISDLQDRLLIRQRIGKGIWRQLYQFPLVETDNTDIDIGELVLHPMWPDWLPSAVLTYGGRGPTFRHQLTHQTISVTFHRLLWKAFRDVPGEFIPVPPTKLKAYAFPRVITRYLEDDQLTLGF